MSPHTVLGVDRSASPDAIHAAYKRLAVRYHPDRNPGDTIAEKRFKDVTEAYRALTASTTSADNPPSVPAAQLGDWLIGEGLRRGGIADLYRVTSAKNSRAGILKIARSARDNPLLTAEAEALKQIAVGVAADPGLGRYFPAVLDSFEASGRRANVLSLAEDCLSLSAIREHFSKANQIDFRHIVWMGNRVFEVLGIVHRQGVVHGAILPQHLLYRPADHGLVIVDWTCGTFAGRGHVPYLVPAMRAHYPPEVLAKRAPSPATDIYMTASALSYIIGKVPTPRAFKPLFDWCLAESPAARPSDPWDLLEKWKAAAKTTYGEPRFVPLTLPSN